jgi:hypothetical protein
MTGGNNGMKRRGSGYLFSPTDLTNYMPSEFIIWMDRYAWEHPAEVQPDHGTEEQRIIQEKDIEHKRALLDFLQVQGQVGKSRAYVSTHRNPEAMRRAEEIMPFGGGELPGKPVY